MGADSRHQDYDKYATAWSQARDVLAGEDAVKAAGEKYLPKLDSQNDEEYLAYKRARRSLARVRGRSKNTSTWSSDARPRGLVVSWMA